MNDLATIIGHIGGRCKGEYAEQKAWEETPAPSAEIKGEIHAHLERLLALLEKDGDRRRFDEVERALLCDPQTSGGLLVSCAAATVDEVLAVFRRHGFATAGVIGEATEGDDGLLVR